MNLGKREGGFTLQTWDADLNGYRMWFGDFDGDGRTDILSKLISRGLRRPLTRQSRASLPLSLAVRAK